MPLDAKKYKDSIQGVPDQYVPVSVAGSGAYGTVFYCLPHETFLASSLPMNHQALRKQLVAVKVPTNTGWSQASKEVDTYRKIFRHPRIDTVESSLCKIFDSEDTPVIPDTCSWFSMRAVYPTIALGGLQEQLIATKQRTPVEFVAHLFLQIGGLLRFLHNECNMTHGDLHRQNVLIDVDSAGESGLPHFVLVDFGRVGKFKGATTKGALDDVRNFCTLFSELEEVMDIAGLKADEAVKWKEFVHITSGMSPKAYGPPGETLGLEQVWETFEGLMKTCRNGVGVEVVAKIREVLRAVVEAEGEPVSGEDLEKAVAGA
ncbi:hypothetical protein BDV96DRAFT_639687 [Lophiotrema nucula]|uniref:Protein kinase domain-containing protein n=1 Tax=Lophiotrema nucula TaxID=690887 RepID=A0A6A5ZXV6_9PLEO|nr:hypothetical protein BDV96DRAFT_639687 [Lophiotrema nucula]